MEFRLGLIPGASTEVFVALDVLFPFSCFLHATEKFRIIDGESGPYCNHWGVE